LRKQTARHFFNDLVRSDLDDNGYDDDDEHVSRTQASR